MVLAENPSDRMSIFQGSSLNKKKSDYLPKAPVGARFSGVNVSWRGAQFFVGLNLFHLPGWDQEGQNFCAPPSWKFWVLALTMPRNTQWWGIFEPLWLRTWHCYWGQLRRVGIIDKFDIRISPNSPRANRTENFLSGITKLSSSICDRNFAVKQLVAVFIQVPLKYIK